MASEVVSYLEMCSREGTSLQRGMNFGLGGDPSVVLISIRSTLAPRTSYRWSLESTCPLGGSVNRAMPPRLAPLSRAILV